MKRSALVCGVLVATLASFFFARRSESAPTPASHIKAAFLVRFGLDGKEGVDWSGSVAAEKTRLRGWQFNAADRINGNAWKCATERQMYWDTPYEAKMQPTSNREKVTAKGILIESESGGPSEIPVTTAQGNFSFSASLKPGDMPAMFLNGRVSVSAVPVAARLSDGPDAEDYPAVLEAKDGTLWVSWQTWSASGDQIFVRHLRSGAWSEPEALTSGGDCFRTALAQDGAGRIWAVWSAQVDRNFDLYGRAFDGKKWSPPERLTTAENSDIYHAMVADASGKIYLAYQSARAGNFDIWLRVFDGRKWGPEIQVSSDPADDWEPALVAAPDGRVTIVWDTYARGNYDVVARTMQNGQLGPLIPIAQSGAFESRASAQYDAQGRLWIAWDEGDWNWGKDYGYELPADTGRGLLVRRQARVAVLENGALRQTAGPIAEAVPQDLRQVFQHPAIAIDGNGNPWVLFRTRVNLPMERKSESRQFRAMWRLEATTYRDGRWTPMMEFTGGDGRIDMPAAVTRRRSGDLAVVWATDGRVWPIGFPRQNDLCFATLAAGPRQSAVNLAGFQASAENLAVPHAQEARDVQRVRDYRANLGSQTWRIVRGDIHRHTDLSWDGNRDGSLDDSYRYALDAVAFDYLGVCDHGAGESIPYNWWRVQKAVDLFTIRGRFAPLYSYERSLKWPNGHRNVLFAARGKPVLDPSAAEQQGTEGAAKLYAYLRRQGGVTASHTSASGMGTDWRDSDAEVEPIVEIYQGYRSNFETQGAPRSPTRKEVTRFTAGFVSNAWAKGIKLGVQASSDHVSTHVSYAGFYVDRVDRDAIIAAMKARRSYAATDNIFVDLRMGDHFMGESFPTTAPLPLTAYVSGTGPIARVEIIRNNKVVYTVPGKGATMRFTYTDQDVQPGESFYYARSEQEDGQLCWSSPIWVTYR